MAMGLGRSGTRLGSMAFKFDEGNTEDSDERKPSDPYVPSFSESGRTRPFVGAPLHFHTSLDEEGDTTSIQSIMICWAGFDGDHWFGTSHLPDIDGSCSPLTPDGLHHMFWKSYNRLLHCAAAEVTISTDLESTDILSMDPVIPKLLYGQKFLLKSYEETISSTGSKLRKCVLQHIPPYMTEFKTKDLYSHASLCWNLVGIPSKYSRKGKVTATDGLHDYTKEDCPVTPPVSFGERYGRRIRYGNLERYDDGLSVDIYWYEYFIATLEV